jgi:hypothetical protein
MMIFLMLSSAAHVEIKKFFVSVCVDFVQLLLLCHTKMFCWLAQAAEIVWRNSGCQSATNTAVARTSILGLHFYTAHAKIMHNALEICNATHPDPRYLP